MSRPTTPKRWQTLVAVGTAAGLVHSAPLQAQNLQQDHMAPAQIWLAAGTEGGEGGEGGESGSAEHADKSLEALTGLALIEGHLRAGITLYRDGQADAAKTHMKHPGDEIYASLEPVLKEVGADGFAIELEALAAAVESGAPVADADAAFAALMEAIEHAGDETGAPARVRFDTMIAVIRVAAEEYGIGVVDGQISNLHEYQDAWGFTQATRAMAQELTTSDETTVAEAATKVLTTLDTTDALFDGISPTGPLTGDASVLQGAAARIELAALSVK